MQARALLEFIAFHGLDCVTRNLFLTGATGFSGIHFLHLAQESSVQVVALRRQSDDGGASLAESKAQWCKLSPDPDSLPPQPVFRN